MLCDDELPEIEDGVIEVEDDPIAFAFPGPGPGPGPGGPDNEEEEEAGALSRGCVVGSDA